MQADAEHAVHAEERGVAVRGRHVEALHVVERRRRVDREAEQARADGVPERRPRRSTGSATGRRRPTVRPACACSCGSASMPMSDSGTTSSAENTAPTAITEVGVPVQYRWCSVPRMPPNRNTMVSITMARLALDGGDEAQAREDERDHGGGEHLEEALDPEVHQPPAPVLDHRVVRVLAPRERRRVEAADAGGRQEHHRDEAAGLDGLASAPATARGRGGTARRAGPRRAGAATRGPCS